MPPLVTALLLTTHPKRAGWLRDSLLAYQLQDYPHRELVVVNDGAPLKAVAPGVTVVNVPAGMSLGAKRNAAAERARGAYLAVWDDDDFSLPERLSLQVAAAERTGAAVVRTNVMWVSRGDLIPVVLCRRWADPHMLIRADAFRRVEGYPDTSYGEGLELTARLRVRGYKEVATDDRFYIHRRHDTNASLVAGSNTLDDHVARSVDADVGPVGDRMRALLAMPRTAYVAEDVAPGPFVSVLCMTTWPKRAAWLRDALLAYQLQDYPHRELVLVNDGDPLTAAAPGVTVVNVAKGLTLGARENVAAAHARGAYLSIFDDDDFYLPERLSTQVRTAVATDADVVRTKCAWIADGDLRVLALSEISVGASMLIKRAAFDRVEGFPDTSWQYDFELYARLAARGLKCVNTMDRYYVYRRHGANVSNAHAGHQLRDNLDAKVAADVAPVNARIHDLLRTPRVAYVR